MLSKASPKIDQFDDELSTSTTSIDGYQVCGDENLRVALAHTKLGDKRSDRGQQSDKIDN